MCFLAVRVCVSQCVKRQYVKRHEDVHLYLHLYVHIHSRKRTCLKSRMTFINFIVNSYEKDKKTLCVCTTANVKKNWPPSICEPSRCYRLAYDLIFFKVILRKFLLNIMFVGERI